MTDKATPPPASVDKQAALVAKLRYMGKQYAAGQVARGGAPQKHYLEEAADEIEMMAWALSMNKVTPASAQENAALRNVIQAACIDGMRGLEQAWAKYFPDHPISIAREKSARMLTRAESTALYEQADSSHHFQELFLRKFCEVNAGCRIPELGKLEGGE